MLNYFAWLLTAGLYAPVFWQLYRMRWEMIDYTHAYFILPVALWLAWRTRKKLLKPEAESAHWGLPLFIFGMLMLIFGWRQDYLFISTLSLIPTLFGLSGYLYGKHAAKVLRFPILYLLLLVPPPLGVLDSITVPMRYGVSVAVASTLHLLNFPIIRDGLMLTIGGHEIYMGAPCSGFRSLITMISLGLAYAYVIKAQKQTKIAVLISIIPLALIGNFARVIAVCLATYIYGESVGAKVHDYGGFAVFLILILGMMGLEAVLEKKHNAQ